MTTPSDILKQVVNYGLTNIHTCLPGEIVDYDYTQQKAKVQPLLRKRYADGTIQSLPEITNVPVVFPSGTGFSMHWPLNAGDNVLLLFSERSLDNWLSTGGEVAPIDPRKFDLSDAIAIPGLIPFPQTTAPQDNTALNIVMGNARMKIDPSGTFCFHGVTEELMSILDELIGDLITLTTQPTPAVGAPLAPVITPILQALQVRFQTLEGNC